MNAIQAAWAEKRGDGEFALSGRKITFKGRDGLTTQWSAATDAQAARQLRIFRAATNYTEAANV